MSMLQTETTSMETWQREGWRIFSCNVPSLTKTVASPCSATDFWNCDTDRLVSIDRFELVDLGGQRKDDIEDLADGLATDLRYRNQGIDNFISYRDYRKRRLRG